MYMDKDGKTPDQKFSGVEFQTFTIDYHTWVWLVFVLEASLQEDTSGLPKWEPRAGTVVYLENFPLHVGPVELVLNTRTGQVSPQYHVIFDNTLSTV